MSDTLQFVVVLVVACTLVALATLWLMDHVHPVAGTVFALAYSLLSALWVVAA